MTSDKISKILHDILTKTAEPDAQSAAGRLAEIRRIAIAALDEVNEEWRTAPFVEKKVNYEPNGDCLWA